jgi:tripartite-type tricarboxylate transporter receptor subunit TctC
MSDSFPGALNRRQLLASVVAAGAASALPLRSALAQARFPTQPLRVIVPFGPGGLADISSRLVAQKLAEKLGQQVVIENRPGAGGVVAATATLNAPHDGYTLILFSNGTTIAKTLLKLPYDPQVDFVPVSTLAYFDLNLLVKNGRYADLKALLAEGRKRQLTLGAINPGSTQHLSSELFKSVAHLNATIVPFKTSGDVEAALQRGDIDVGFESYAALRGPIDAGLIHAIATTGPKRTPWLPNVPTAAEAGLPGYEVTGWNALYVAKGAPAAAVATLNAAIGQVMAEPDVQKRLLGLGVEPRASSSAELGKLFEHDRRKWAQVIKQANIKV